MIKSSHHSIFLNTLCCLITGILVNDRWLELNLSLSILLILFALFSLVFFYIDRVQNKLLYSVFIYLVAFILGFQKAKPVLLKGNYDFIGVVQKQLNNNQYEIGNISLIQDKTNQKLKGSAILKTSIPLKSGYCIVANGYFSQITSFKNPNGFDPQEYYTRKGIYYNCKSNKLKVIDNHYSIPIIANKWKKTIEERITKIYGRGESAQLLKALIIGNKSSLDKDIIRNFKNTGTMHILAVSGLHVGIIYLFISFLFKVFNLNKRSKEYIVSQYLIILALWCYAIITGMSPSVIRASIMLSLYIIGKAHLRNINPLHILYCTAFIYLIFDTQALFTISFQLSFSAVFGILYLFPKVQHIINSKYVVWQAIKYTAIVSIIAQLSVLPVILLYFHTFPSYFLLANLLVIHAASLLIYSGISSLVLFELPILGPTIKTCCEWISNYILYAVDQIESLPGSQLNISSDWTSSIFLAIILVLIFSLSYHYSSKKIAVTALLCILLTSYNIYDKYYLNTTTELFVFDSYSKENLAIRAGNHIYTSLKPKSREITALSKDKKIKNVSSMLPFSLQRKNYQIIEWNNQIIINNVKSLDSTIIMLEPNFVILSSISDWTEEQLLKLSKTKIILDKSIQNYDKFKISGLNSDDMHFISTSGYFSTVIQ